MGKMTKRVLLALILIVFMAMLSGCMVDSVNKATKKEPDRITNAILRYFDGSSEMVETTDVYPRDGYVVIDTVYGQRIRIGWNNVILIEEDETP